MTRHCVVESWFAQRGSSEARSVAINNFKFPARGPVISRRLNRRASKMRRMNMSLLGISGLKSWRHAHACRRRDRGMCASCQQRSCCNPHPHGASKMQGVVDMYVPRSHPMRRSLHVPVYGSRAWFVSEKWEHAKNQIWCSDVSIVNSQEKSWYPRKKVECKWFNRICNKQ